MTNIELLKRYVKAHDSVLVLYQHYDENEERGLPSIDEYLLHEVAFYENLVANERKNLEENEWSLESECLYYQDKERLDYTKRLLTSVTDSNTRYWLRTDEANGKHILMPVAEKTPNLVWGEESMGDVNLKEAGRVTNLLSFLWGEKRVYLCSDGEVLYKLSENSVVVRKENSND